MAPSKAPDDPETLTFDATVEEGGEKIVLSETYFYPAGGGQPADRGTLGGCEVLDVQTIDGDVVHTIEGEIESRTTVTGEIDPEFRRYCMRAHTASHILYGAGRKLFEDLGYGGFGITSEKIRVDFRTSSQIDDETLVELEQLVNRCIWESRNVTWNRMPRAEALDRDDIAFNTKTEEGITGETVRVVEIDCWDVAACGGTHVPNTRRIGSVSVLDRSNPGEGLTRVEFGVGLEGLDRRVLEKHAALQAAETLETNVESLAEEVQRLQSEYEELQSERDALRSELLEFRIEAMTADSFTRDERQWAADVVEAESNGLAEAVRERPDDIDVLVLANPSGQLAVGAGPIDANEVIAELTETFGGGGGGSPDVAQAGGLETDGDAIVEYLRDQQ